EDPPERRPLAEIELTEDQGHVQPADQAHEVKRHEDGDTEKPAACRLDVRAGEQVRARGPDVLDRRRRRLVRPHGGLRGHRAQVYFSALWPLGGPPRPDRGRTWTFRAPWPWPRSPDGHPTTAPT